MFTKTETEALLKEMERGYNFEDRDTSKTIDIWYPVWEKAVEENRKMGSRDFFACFDNKVHIGQYINSFNWVGDLELAFLNSGKEKATERTNFCTVLLEEFKPIPSMGNLKQNLAELYYLQGKQEEGEALFEELVKEEPYNVYLWADYARAYSRRQDRDNEKVYAIYKRAIDTVMAESGLSPDSKNFLWLEIDYLYDEIAKVCKLLGRDEEAVEWTKKSRAIAVRKEAMNTERTRPKQQTIIHPPKVKRNDPCPCGSRKKYKNCCLNKKRK